MNQRVISVQGRGTATAEPDLVQLSFSISVMDQEYDRASSPISAATSVPHLSQKLESDRSSLPHFLQNIVALPLPVYANSEYNMGTLYQQKRRAVQVRKHPHDPNPNAGGSAKG